MKAIVVHEPGGPEALKLEEVAEPTPGEGQAVVEIYASGINFIDTYHRSGLYPSPDKPFRIGVEGAGKVSAVGPGVTSVQVGDRVAWCMDRGSYAESATIAASKLVPLPPEVDYADAAQLLLQGLTAHYLTRSTFPLQAGHTCLVHAAAGGTGTLIVQMAKIAGATVIGTVSTAQKLEQAKAAGCDEIINYRQQDFAEEVKRITGGRGVDVVYDGVGKSTWDGSLSCLRPRGMMVLFGQASGSVSKFDPQVLNQKGSIFLTRPSLGHYVATREELLGRAAELFGWKASRDIRVFYDRSYKLEEAADAHRDLEKRKSLGKLMLAIR
jgi:NADPH2:quinone reductase